MQKYTSKNTAINSKKFPKSTKQINWELFRDTTIIDIGGGPYDNLKEYLLENYDINLLVYDPFHRPNESIVALENLDFCSLIICNNCLCVINDDKEIESLINRMYKEYHNRNIPFIIQIYEGNKTSKGSETKKDCYQRNQTTKEFHKQFFSNYPDICVYKNLILSTQFKHILL